MEKEIMNPSAQMKAGKVNAKIYEKSMINKIKYLLDEFDRRWQMK